MKTLFIHGREDIRLEDVPTPEPGPGEVRLRIAYVGVCGSDLHYYFNGANGAFVVEEPMAPGHEVSGVVDLDPSGKLASGTPVTVHPATFGEPIPGIEDKRHLFPGGSYLGSASTHPHTQGGMSEFLIVKDFMVRPLPAGMDLHVAALAEPLGVALHGINVAGGVEGKRVVVSGSGPIGLLAAAAAVAKGAAEVVSTDVLAGPLDRARRLGARPVRVGGAGCADVDASDGAGGAGTAGGAELPCGHFDVALECSGIPAAVSATIEAVRPAGVHAQIGMMGAGPQPIALATLIAKEIQLRGCFRFNTEIDEAIELLAARPEIADVVVTHVFKGDSADSAVEAFTTAKDSDVSGKVLVDMRG
ncbi:GroES-like protein [Actinomyces sp. oral taxon 848 str. F0332]|nr:GroES-like protein [Actinomyces sp. oral taxon 848 str. F0332]